MHLSDFDLQLLDKARRSQLTVAQKEALLEKALEDRKEARERLKADSRTRSRPPSSDAPWSSAGDEEATPEPETGMEVEHQAGEEETPVAEGQPPQGQSRDSKRPGRRPASAGHSRTQKLPVTGSSLCPSTARCVEVRWPLRRLRRAPDATCWI